MTKSQKKVLFLSSLGGVLEFYDFIIYALLASYISKEFFPTGDNISSLLATFATFSVGYLVRPLGGILFGHFGDKLGRKKTFTFSILMMAVATFCVGLVPSYASIGISAPIILTALRVIQGLSIGGEIPGAIAYVTESIPERKGFACGIIFFALINGIVLGSLIQAIFSTLFSNQQMLIWGWRLLFFIGGISGFLSYLMRRQLEESALFKTIEDKIEAFPIIAVFQSKLLNASAAVFVVGLGASIITLLFLFTPAYLGNVLHIDTNKYIWFNTFAIFLSGLFCIVFGALSDIYKHKILFLFVCVLSIIFVYPIFYIYAKHFSFFLIALLISAFLNGFAWGVIPNLLADLFPTQIRYSGIAISYNLGFAIFGGLTPVIAMLLIYKTGMVIAPTFYLILTATIALVALLFIKRLKH
jgi:MFS family permease